MTLNILHRVPIENFSIENNIIKGVHQEMPESYQIGKLLLDLFNSKPDHVSQIQAETDKQTTFAEMKENSVRCALWLRKQGIGSGDIVTICCDNNLRSYIPVLATFFVGATHNAWHDSVSIKEVQHLIRTLQPKVIFASGKVANVIIEAGKIENFQGIIVVYDIHSGLQSLEELMDQQTSEEVKNFEPRMLTNPKDVAYIIMTSGSTGFPKGVTHSYGSIVKQIATCSSYAMKGVILTYSHWNWITGFLYCMQSIFIRGTRILHSRFDPEETCKVIEKYEVENLLLSASGLCLYSKTDILRKYQLKSLKVLLVGGCKIPDHLLHNFRKMLPHVIVVNAMGPSEMGRMALSQTEKCKVTGSVGYVMSGTEIKICDLKSGEALGPNMPGELYLKSKTITKGYYNNEAATKAAIDDEGWYHTGDVAYYDENGEFVIIDRIKEVMKYQSHQVSPTEIEAVLLEHPGVLEAVVVPIPHEIDGEHPMAFVKKSPDSKVTEEELVRLSECLGEIKKLHGGVKFIDEIPKLSTAKVDRQTLKQRAKLFQRH